MEEDRNQVTEKILDITLEILSLLAGEDHMVVRRKSAECSVSCMCRDVSEGSCRIRSCSSVSAPRFPLHERHNEQKILELSNQIIRLLTGEVVAQCLSMEEWEYLGKEKLYKDSRTEDHQPLHSTRDAEGFESPLLLNQHWETKAGGINEATERGEDEGKLLDPVSPCPEGNHTGTRSPSTRFKEESDSVEGDHLADTSACLLSRRTSTDVKEDPDSCQEGNLSDAEHTEIEYISVCIKEESDSWDDENLPNVSSPPVYPATRTVQEVVACEGNLMDCDVHGVTPDTSPRDADKPSNCKSPQSTHKLEPMFTFSERETCFTGNSKPDKHQAGHTENLRIPSKTGKVMFSGQDCGSSDNSRGEPFSCPEDGEQCSENGDLVTHETIHAAGNSSFQCDECGKCFAQAKRLALHKKTHMEEKTLRCGECGKYFTEKYLLIHQRTHTGEKPFRCDECGKGFIRAANLTAHKKIHNGEKPYKCDDCGKGFTQPSILALHKKSHTEEKTFKCEECGKYFTEKYLLVHQRTHTGEKPFKCDKCEKCFITASNLTAHKKIHSGEKPHKCDECGKCFIKATNLIEHKRIHTGEKPFKCDECGKCFPRAIRLALHKRIHAEDKPFECSECGKYFTQNYELISHQRIHTGEKPFKCDQCGKCFTTTSNLKVHRRIHTREKPA
uniref:C2H2-type domain-containing protein n=1 Tax=Leptobrachium leishanense TaxID=445787 RepID=A0A8C5Q172_9ANUR